MEIELLHSFIDVYLVKPAMQINSASVLMCLIVLSLYIYIYDNIITNYFVKPPAFKSN